jgi:hypothetical protein
MKICQETPNLVTVGPNAWELIAFDIVGSDTKEYP